MGWTNSYRSGISFLYVYYGNIYVFSLRKYNFSLSRENIVKVIKRTILIFLVKLGLNLFNHIIRYDFTEFENLRILGIMQRLALAYGVESLIGLGVNHKYLLQIAGGILIFYWALLGFTDSMTMSTGNIVAVVDRIYSENHICIKILWQTDPGSLLIRKGF